MTSGNFCPSQITSICGSKPTKVHTTSVLRALILHLNELGPSKVVHSLRSSSPLSVLFRSSLLASCAQINVVELPFTHTKLFCRDPRLLCQFLMDQCLSRNVHLHQPAKPISVARSSSGSLSDITILNTTTQEEKTLPCTHLILAAGAWSAQVHRTLFPSSKISLPISSLSGHSLVLRSPHWPPKPDVTDDSTNSITRQDCHAVFTTDAEGGYSPEIFSRMPDGHIYLAGLNSSTYHLPKIANERIIDPSSIEVLKKTAHNLLGDDFEVVREGVCWRPVAKRGVPIVADLKAKGEEGVIVSAGHGAWGISNSLGTGYIVAGMVEGRDMEEYVGLLGV